MKEQLKEDYEVSVDDMIDAISDVGDFKVTTAEFYNKAGKIVNKNILSKDGQQIFSMKDGKFVLEVEDDGFVEYFCSNDINDLI